MRLRAAFFLGVVACATAAAQSPPDAIPSLVFEVASIKRSASDVPGYMRIEPGSRFTAVSASPMLIIRQAYGMPPFQLANVPGWVNDEYYDILAKAPDGVEVAPNMAALLQSLLRDRFGFQAHVETRDVPTYELVVARVDRRLGAKLQRATFDCASRTPGAPSPVGANGEPLCGITGGPNRIVVRGYSLARFAASLSAPLQRVVVDKTGLPGPWNLDIEFTPDQPARPNDAVVALNPDAPPLVTAVQEQLGLKLEASRGRVEVLVIDRISRPTTD